MMNSGRLTFEFDFGMGEYRGYVVARDSRIVRMASAVAGVCVLMLALGTLPVRTGGDKVVVCGLAAIAVLLLLGGIFGRLPWFSAARRPQAEAYLSRHGATDGQPSFRQRVVLADDGITVVFGPHSCWPSGARTIKKPWLEWKRVVSARDGVLVEADTHQGGPLSGLLGFNMLLRMAERDGFQDAFIPAGALVGVDSKELAKWVHERIRASR